MLLRQNHMLSNLFTCVSLCVSLFQRCGPFWKDVDPCGGLVGPLGVCGPFEWVWTLLGVYEPFWWCVGPPTEIQ